MGKGISSKWFKTVLILVVSTIFLVMCGSAFAAENNEQPKKTMKERLAEMKVAQSANILKFAFYLDSDGHANYEQKVLDNVVKVLQSKLPANARLEADSQLLGDFDLYREEKYNEIMTKMYAEKPEYAMLTANTTPSGQKIQMTNEVIDQFLETTDYDGLVIVRIDKVQEKASVNYTNAILFGFGGVNTKVEMDVTTRVFNKHNPKGYVFNNRQRVVAKVHGTWASETASRKAIPMAMKNVKVIKVE